MRRIAVVLGLAALALAGVFAGVFLPAGGASTTAADATTTVTVSASEFKYVFSKKTVPVGTVIFKVVNKGKISHDFKIAGKKTAVLSPGKSQLLKVTIKKAGNYAFLCTLTGHAGAGMKGTYRVGTPTTKVAVKASEFKFVFSRKTVPVGKVTFIVKNTGKISHDFKIAGKKTKVLSPGKSQLLTVTITKKGNYAFLCTLTGHAGAGMKGKYPVGTTPVATTTGTTTQPPPPPPPPPPPTGTVGTANTTVQVGMVEYGFNLSQTTMPSGQVTFVIKNNGAEVHNFSVTGVKAGQILDPGQSQTYTVGLPAARFSIVCDVPFHIDRGMVGSITVTP